MIKNNINERMLCIAKNTEKYVKQLRDEEFQVQCLKCLEEKREPFSFNNLPVALPSKNGIYMFWVKLPIRLVDCKNVSQAILEEWNSVHKEFKSTSYAKFNKTRANKLFKELNSTKKADWLPLYIGKHSNVRKRVLDEHIGHANNKTTYSMKLKAFSESSLGWEFAVAAICFDVLENSYYLCEILEASLRKHANPIIGS